jgi:hypothetical protein
LNAQFSDGELSFSIDDVMVINRIFVGEQEGSFVVAQWKLVASTFPITDRTDGKKLCATLRKLAVPDNPAIVNQIVAFEAELSAVDRDIERQEVEMNSIVYNLYGVTDEEIDLIERAGPCRFGPRTASR